MACSSLEEYSMHPVLRITDLQHLFFAGCERKSLARLARTCKSFHEIALDVLWRDDADIVSLLKVMPENLWFVESNGKFHFRRSITSADLVMFNKYARRIYSLSYEPDYLNEDTILTLKRCMPKPMLPNLRSFSSNPHFKDEDCILTSLLLYPGIESISVNDMIQDSPSTLSLLAEIHSLAHSLTSLTMYINYRNRTLMDIVTQTTRLRILRIPTLTPSALRHVLTAQSLRILNCFIRNDHVDLLLASGAHSQTQMSELTLSTSGKASVFHRFIDLTRPCQLRKLSLTQYHVETPPDSWPRCFQQISAYYSSTLQILIICDFHGIRDTPRSTDRATLQCLLGLRCLTKLHIFGFGHLFTFEEDHVEELALAWPHLQVLDFSSTTGGMPPPQTTLTGLASLFRCCEQLEDLTISIDARIVNPWLENGRACKQTDVRLSLGDSPIENPDEVSAFLAQNLPIIHNNPRRHLHLQYGQGSVMSMLYQDRWDVVFESLQPTSSMGGSAAVDDLDSRQ